jgi:ankyrin repeat protein
MENYLFTSIEQHDLRWLGTLLASGADPNVLMNERPYWRPLHAAVNELDSGAATDMIALLLRHGADVNAWDRKRHTTPLLVAIFNEQPRAAEMLLEAGADPNVKNDEGDFPLLVCAELGDLRTALRLLASGADKTMNDWGGLSTFTPLGQAAARLDLPMLRALLDAGANPLALDLDRRMAIQRLPAPTTETRSLHEAALTLLSRPPMTR